MKKHIIVFMLITLVLFGNISHAKIFIEGGSGDLVQTNWVPKKAYIEFDYDSENKLSRCWIAFKTDGGKLFKRWKLKDDGGETIPFPFVLESTLVIDQPDNIDLVGSWGFGRFDKEDYDLPDAYLDSIAFDDLQQDDDPSDKYGIGIIINANNIMKLDGNEIYEYWIDLKQLEGSVDPKTIKAQLRFRLNIDLAAAKQFGYSKWQISKDFKLGKGWRGLLPFSPYGYNQVDLEKDYTPQEIGKWFSFSIEKYKPTDFTNTYSDFFNLSGMKGKWCQKRGEDKYEVANPQECFKDDSSGGSIVCIQSSTTSLALADYQPSETSSGDTCTAQDDTDEEGKDKNSGQPDMDVHRSKLGNGQFTTRHRRLTADSGENIYGFVKARNKGSGNADDVNISFYLDAGKIDFKREDKDFIDSHYVGKFLAGQETWYVVGFHAPEEPGEYTFYGCIDNSNDKRYENNCPIMKNELEYARLTVEEPPLPPPVFPDLTISNLQINNNPTTIAGGTLYGFSSTIHNNDKGETNGSFQVRYQIRKENESNYSPIGESTFKEVINPFSYEYHETGNFALTPYEEGKYFIRACVDSDNTQAESNENNNCSEEIEVYISPPENPNIRPVYRFYSRQNPSHFFTISEAEKNWVIENHSALGFRYEGIAFCTYNTQEDDSLPVYRFYSEQNPSHFYTISENERNTVLNVYTGWRDEGIGWYAFNYQKSETIPVYRFYHAGNPSHFFTAFESERDKLLNEYIGWRDEGIAFYAFDCSNPPAPSVDPPTGEFVFSDSEPVVGMNNISVSTPGQLETTDDYFASLNNEGFEWSGSMLDFKRCAPMENRGYLCASCANGLYFKWLEAPLLDKYDDCVPWGSGYFCYLRDMELKYFCDSVMGDPIIFW